MQNKLFKIYKSMPFYIHRKSPPPLNHCNLFATKQRTLNCTTGTACSSTYFTILLKSAPRVRVTRTYARPLHVKKLDQNKKDETLRNQRSAQRRLGGCVRMRHVRLHPKPNAPRRLHATPSLQPSARCLDGHRQRWTRLTAPNEKNVRVCAGDALRS